MADEEKKQDSTVQTNVTGETTTSEFASRQEWEARKTIEIRSQYEQLLGLWKEEELNQLRKEYDKITEEGVKKLFNAWLEEQKPPSHDDIQQLLSQEYETFTLPVNTFGNPGEATPRMFTIRELPQEAEIQFYKGFKDRLLKNVPALQAIAQETMDMPFEERMRAIFSAFDEGFDILADAVVIILNPFGEDKDIDRKWVQRNIASQRQWQIVDAQIKVNRLKDFFSKLFQSGQSMQTTMIGQNFQRLQQLVR